MKEPQRLVPGVLLAALVLALSASLAGEQQVARKDFPPAVLAAFEKAYPNATIKAYVKEKIRGQMVYEFESVEGRKTRDVAYTAEGVVVAIEETLEASELPPAVKAALDRRFPGWQILLAEKLTVEGVVTYNLEIRHNGRKARIRLDAAGNESKR
jgi:uncharacterized membrane protein YkoI